MGTVDYIENLIEELRKQGYKAVLLKDLVRRVVEEKGVYPQTVYNAVKILEIKGKVKITGNRKNKVVYIQ